MSDGRPIRIAAESSREAALDAEGGRVLTGLVQAFGSTLELDQVLRTVADGVKSYLDYDTFAVLLLDELGQQLHFRFAVGYSDEVVRNWRFGLGQGIVGTAAKNQEVVSVGDVHEDSRYITAVSDTRSELAIPLVVKNRTVGVLDVGSRKPDHFTDSQRRLLALLASHLANGIENARLYESVRDQARTLSLLHEISRDLTSILDRQTLLHKVAEGVKRVIDYQHFSVMLWNETTRVLDHTFSLGFVERLCKKDGFPLGYGVTGTAAALRQPLRVPNVHLDPRYVDCGHEVEVRSELAVPLVYKDLLIGVIDLESLEYNAFSEQHEQMLSTLSAYVAVALENARLYERVSEGERLLERDLETAREIQQRLLPPDAPQVPGSELVAAYRPARQLGGDFYDFMSYGRDRLALAVGDVTGKGTAAALYGSLAVGMLRGLVVEHPWGPAEMLARMNRHLEQRQLDNRFVAMIFGVYDGTDRSLTLANAGFTRPLLVRRGVVREVPIEGRPLGLFPDVAYDERRIALEPGDVVILCSDGIPESTDRSCEEFGSRRLKSLLVELASRPAREIAEQLIDSAERYVVGSRSEIDDRVAVVLKVV